MANMLEDAQLDELIARRKVVEYSDETHGIRQIPSTGFRAFANICSLMTIPGIETLPESQLPALRSKLL